MKAGRGRPRHPDVLTPAEWRVVNAIRHGMSAPAIAARQQVSLDAVKFHVANVMAKLGLANRAELRSWRGVAADSAMRGARAKVTAAMAYPLGASREGDQMSVSLGPIGQISRQVSDIARAVDWYGGTLGLPHLYTFGDLAFFDCDGVRLYLQQVSSLPAAQSAIYFRTQDINIAYDDLAGRGVVFRGAPHMIHRHESGIEEWMAFFDDPDAQPLALMEQIPPPRDS